MEANFFINEGAYLFKKAHRFVCYWSLSTLHYDRDSHPSQSQSFSSTMLSSCPKGQDVILLGNLILFSATGMSTTRWIDMLAEDSAI